MHLHKSKSINVNCDLKIILTLQNRLSRNGPIDFANVSYSQPTEADTALNSLRLHFGLRAKRNTPREVREQEKQARVRQEQLLSEKVRKSKKV